MLGEQNILAVVVHLPVLMLPEAIERLIGSRIEDLLNRVKVLAVNFYGIEAATVPLGQQRATLRIEKGHRAGVERDLRNDAFSAQLYFSVHALRGEWHVAWRGRCDHQAFRQIECLRRRGNPDDAIRHDLQPHLPGSSPARLDHYTIWLFLILLIGARVAESYETKGAERQQCGADGIIHWVFSFNIQP